MAMRTLGQIRIQTPSEDLERAVTTALKSWGLSTGDGEPLAALVDLRPPVSPLPPDCPWIGLVDNTLEQRQRALELGATVVVSDADVGALAGYLAEMVLIEELGRERILIFEDCPTKGATIEAILVNQGFTVRLCQDSYNGLDAMESFRPDVVLLDFEMPDLEAPNFCRILRADPRWSRLPVIFFTAKADRLAEALASGADDVLHEGEGWFSLINRLEVRIKRNCPHRLQQVDPLTGCLERRHAIPLLDRLVRLANRKRRKFSLALLDLDHFKKINDQYGHQVGDQVLARFGKLLRHSFRQEDVVARWGGEEFLVAFFDTDKQSAAVRLDQVLRDFSRLEFPMLEAPPSFTGAVAELEADGSDLTELFLAADQTLYRAKAEGRNRVRLCPPRLVLVEDDPEFADILTRMAKLRGLEIRHYTSAERAMEDFRLHWPEVCIIDQGLPGMSGLDMIEISSAKATKFILVSSQVNGALRSRADRLRATHCLEKSDRLSQILDSAEALLRSVPSDRTS